MASAKNNQRISTRPHFSPSSTAKTNGKVQISGRMASFGISDVVSIQYTPRKPV